MWLIASPGNREARLARRCLRADRWALFGSAHSAPPCQSRPQVAQSFMNMRREMISRPLESDDRAIVYGW
eukprot:15440995-Alexandrium_andersonii.AAC.1